ncbi:MAG: NAD(P)/FAD-dependent oxidoreductase [Pseudomonadota bacterium]
MNTTALMDEDGIQEAGHVDVLIVGAGISGVDAAYHLQQHFPERTFTLLDTIESFGGTWLTHKYPGIRSDSDLFTFGYKWKPWMGAPIATAEEILKYMEEAIAENNIGEHIRYRHKVVKAQWSSEDKQWTVIAENLANGELLKFTCHFLWMCQGYYKHAEGYTPEWEGMADFRGLIFHPQTWPEDLDYKDKRVLVIGSGATAATLVPAMAENCAHITMLQRSPTFFAPGLNRNELADMLRGLDVPNEWTHEIVRRQMLHDQQELSRRSFEEPEALREELIEGAREYLPDDFDIETHFTPKYRPWQQRLAFISDGDLFQGIAAGKASVMTDHIERFTETEVMLQSGREIEADIIVTATGFNLCVLGDIDFVVDGEPVNFADRVGYSGFMFSGVPNMAWVFGYFRASWTLRADLISEYVCRIFKHMEGLDATEVTPQLRPQDEDMAIRDWVDPDNFNPGYLTRRMHLMPKQGEHEPWVFTQDYWLERDEFPAANLEDGALLYS